MDAIFEDLKSSEDGLEQTQQEKAVFVVPKIKPVEQMRLVRLGSEKKFEAVDTKTGLAYPLEAREAKESLLFKKRVFQNKAGESKVIYTREDRTKVVALEPTKFLDFKYRSRLSRDDIVEFFENIVTDKPQRLDISKVDFSDEIHPKVFSREYVNSVQSIDLFKEEELQLGKRLPTGSREKPKQVNMIAFSFSSKKPAADASASKPERSEEQAETGNSGGIPNEDEEENRIQMIKSFRLSDKEEKEIMGLITHIKSLFQLRPVWLKSSLEAELALRDVKYPSDFSLKKALAATSYLIKNGPWKFTYARFGFDPRKSKDAIEFQSFNVGIRNRHFMSESRIRDQKSHGVVDFKKRNFHNVQICDVQDSTVRELVAHQKKQNSKSYHQVCDEKFGWIDRKTYSLIIKRLKDIMRKKAVGS